MDWFVTYCIFPQSAVGLQELLGRLQDCVYVVCAFYHKVGQLLVSCFPSYFQCKCITLVYVLFLQVLRPNFLGNIVVVIDGSAGCS